MEMLFADEEEVDGGMGRRILWGDWIADENPARRILHSHQPQHRHVVAGVGLTIYAVRFHHLPL